MVAGLLECCKYAYHIKQRCIKMKLIYETPNYKIALSAFPRAIDSKLSG